MDDVKPESQREEKEASKVPMTSEELQECIKLSERELLNLIRPEEYLSEDEVFEYYHDQAVEFFGHDADYAFEKYLKNHNWSAMAETLWELYCSYFGLGKMQQLKDDPSRRTRVKEYHKQYLKSANRLLSHFFDSSFRMLDEEPREKACIALRSLYRRMERYRADEVATSQGTSELIQMYDSFLTHINIELSFQQKRTEEAPLLPVSKILPDILEEKKQPILDRVALQEKGILNFEEAALYVDLKKSYLYKLTSTGELKYFKQGKFNRFYRTELDAWLKKKTRDISSRTEIDSEAATYVVLHKGDVKPKETIYSKERNIQKEPVKLPTKKQEVKKVITPIKWKESEALLKGVAAGLHKKGFVSDEQSFVNQFHVIEVAGGQKECNATEWTGDKTALTYLFSELQKLGAVFQKIKIWETVALHFTAEGKPINNLKQAKYGYSGGKPKAAPMIDEILAIFSVSK